jgi:hypothetical protein
MSRLLSLPLCSSLIYQDERLNDSMRGVDLERYKTGQGQSPSQVEFLLPII